MKRFILPVALMLAFCINSFAAETTIIPRLKLQGEYTDNLDRTPDNEEDDYIFSTSPGVTLDVKSETARLNVRYDPAYVQYKENSDRDQWRHYATLLGDWSATKRTKLGLFHSLTVSEDPADDEGTSTAGRGRNRYMRNTGRASITNQFGRNDTVTLGYSYSLLKNEEDFVEDSQRYNPYVDFLWWFIDNRYALSLNGGYTKGDFEVSDDFDSYVGQLRLLRRFGRNFDMFLQYLYGQTDYDGDTEGYKVHNPAIGFNYAAGEKTNISLAFGYGIRDREVSEDNQGFLITGDLSTAFDFKRGGIEIVADSGYTQDAFSTENLGFYVYTGAKIRAHYDFTRILQGDVSGLYRYADYLDTTPEIEDHEAQGGIGLNLQALTWMNFRLEYTHRNLTSSSDAREYSENRAMMYVVFTPAKPYRF